jgi:hypothetical protein
MSDESISLYLYRTVRVWQWKYDIMSHMVTVFRTRVVELRAECLRQCISRVRGHPVYANNIIITIGAGSTIEITNKLRITAN